MIEITTIRTVTIIVRVDVGPNFDPTQPEVANASGQFLRGKINVLQWNCAEPGKTFRIFANNFRDVIV